MPAVNSPLRSSSTRAGGRGRVQYTRLVATLRLFASVRVAAGTGRADFDAETVGGVIEAAIAAYGPQFAEQVQQCRVWLDGEPAEWHEAVGADSEVALLPPVSGG